jgi:hypothetical protein
MPSPVPPVTRRVWTSWLPYEAFAVVVVAAVALAQFRYQRSAPKPDASGELFFCLPRDLDAVAENRAIRPDAAVVANRRRRAIASCPEAQRLLRERRVLIIRQGGSGEWEVWVSRPLDREADLP